MCGLCGVIGETQDWSQTISNQYPRRQERYQRIKLLNQILAPYKIKISDFQGVNYLIQTATGKQSVVNGIQALWNEIDTLCHIQIDVLDGKYLAQLECI